MDINQIGKKQMYEITKFRAEGQSIAIDFLKSFIREVSDEKKKGSNFAKIIDSTETSLIFECTNSVYQKISKKVNNIALSIVPI